MFRALTAGMLKSRVSVGSGCARAGAAAAASATSASRRRRMGRFMATVREKGEVGSRGTGDDRRRGRGGQPGAGRRMPMHGSGPSEGYNVRGAAGGLSARVVYPAESTGGQAARGTPETGG